MHTLELHRWRYRDERTGKVVTTRYLATEEEARNRYGDRLIEAVPGSREVRDPDPTGNSTSAFLRATSIPQPQPPFTTK